MVLDVRPMRIFRIRISMPHVLCPDVAVTFDGVANFKGENWVLASRNFAFRPGAPHTPQARMMLFHQKISPPLCFNLKKAVAQLDLCPQHLNGRECFRNVSTAANVFRCRAHTCIGESGAPRVPHIYVSRSIISAIYYDCVCVRPQRAA